MKTYVTSDTHFQHEGVLGMSQRPFASIEDHDHYLLDRINETVKESDRLFHLGDFAWRGEESLVARIRCKNIHFIRGNHDKAKVDRIFKTAEDTTIIRHDDQKVFLSHYPHCYWPSSHYGALHLYGHMHGQREATLDAMFRDRRSMDVGVDEAKRLLGDYVPFDLDWIVSRLLQRPGHDPVEWYRQLQAKAAERDVKQQNSPLEFGGQAWQ